MWLNCLILDVYILGEMRQTILAFHVLCSLVCAIELSVCLSFTSRRLSK